MLKNDTICALATAIGGALGIIRISGPKSFDAVSSICTLHCEDCEANTIHFTHITSDSGEIIDEVLVSIFRTPHSYTGENSIEISCHGSAYILNKVLSMLIANGCRQAQPGEFTMRAYLNGRIDLSQAEAVADLIASTNQANHKLAMSQLRGQFSSELSLLRENLLKLTSLLELELDFSDHEDLQFASRKELLYIAKTIDKRVSELAASFKAGNAIKQGIPVAIVGKTNVGKSTLLNYLLKDDRAIVSNIHGTTRDIIEDVIDIQGISFRFIDTAGIRQTTDAIEQLGIRRTYQAISKARIVLWLIDTLPPQAEMAEMAEKSKDKALIIAWNKIDKSNNSYMQLDVSESLSVPYTKFLRISAKYGTNLDLLENAIYQAADLPKFHENSTIVTSIRHYDALVKAQESISRFIEGLNMGLSGDLLAEDLRLTLTYLAEITGGQITTNEMLGNIFQHFCVGK
jgi:tRNA modification GTPase